MRCALTDSVSLATVPPCLDCHGLLLTPSAMLGIDFVCGNEFASLFDVKGGSTVCSMDLLEDF